MKLVETQSGYTDQSSQCQGDPSQCHGIATRVQDLGYDAPSFLSSVRFVDVVSDRLLKYVSTVIHLVNTTLDDLLAIVADLGKDIRQLSGLPRLCHYLVSLDLQLV